MRLQVLISTMNQNDYSLLDKMNISSDAIVVNQCDKNKIEEFEYKGHTILWMSLKERGIGLSRNTALMRSTADIILFSDDDVCYDDGYEEKIISSFNNNANADILLMDLRAIGKNDKKPYSFKKIRWYNSLNFGAVHFACKRESIFKKSLSFNLLFGGGARYSCGEDNIFLSDALKKGLNVYTVPGYIGSVTYENSSWFKGYNDKYFYDKGILMGTIFGRMAYPLTIVLFLKNNDQTKDYGLTKAISKAIEGIRNRL